MLFYRQSWKSFHCMLHCVFGCGVYVTNKKMMQMIEASWTKLVLQ